jgi:methylglutaconyl-CoA hydratase
MSARPRLTFRSSRIRRSWYSTESTPLLRITNLAASNSGHIRVLELNRPSARNAISVALLRQLRAEVDAVQAQYTEDGEEASVRDVMGPTRALIIASAIDTSFCSGADLKERRGFTQEQYALTSPIESISTLLASMLTIRLCPRTNDFLTNLRGTLSALASLPIPTISAISSLALGGGLELALSTHFRVLASTATVGLPETRLGIIPGAGGTHRLPALIGLARARDLILTGRRVAAPEAYFIGIADRLVEVTSEEAETDESGNVDRSGKGDTDVLTRARQAALSEAVRLAQEICEGGPVAVRAALKAVSWAREEVENQMYERVIGTEDRDEALKAFQEKRKPVFKGR